MTERVFSRSPRWFHDNLYDLLVPENWRVEDDRISEGLPEAGLSSTLSTTTAGDALAYPLQRFMEWLAEHLDEMKAEIENLSLLFDVDACPEDLLPYLAFDVGVDLRTDLSAAVKRTIIKNAIPSYKKKGTAPMILSRIRDYCPSNWIISSVATEDFDSPGARLLYSNDYIHNPTNTPPIEVGRVPIEFISHILDTRLAETLANWKQPDDLNYYIFDEREGSSSAFADFNVDVQTFGETTPGDFEDNPHIQEIRRIQYQFLPVGTALLLHRIN